jgi:DNA repair exonuclease SbcCD ATPase subunit
MRLTSVRLCPFGRFTDASWDLAKPLVVVHGPNEIGKSTLRQAIVHALFTPTKLTANRLALALGPWMPLPAGDYAAVTLSFEHAGTTWRLEKRWGAGAASRLSDGTTSLADPEAVQQRLATMLEHGEATFRHVLFTGQAELERTIEAIKENAAGLRDIRDLLGAAAGAGADVDEQRLRTLLEAKIQAAFSRWDDERERPERQNGQERGVGNPWRREVGDILATWYAWQAIVAEHQAILDVETERDRVGLDVASIEDSIRERAAFVTRYGGLRGDLAERGQLEERKPRLEQGVAAMKEAFSGWPKAQVEIDAWQKRKPEIEEQIAKLRQERADADARRAGAATAASLERIKQAKQACEDAEKEVGKLVHPGDDVLNEIARLEREITLAENQLAARTLSWRIEAEKPDEVTVERGNDPPAALTAGSEATQGTAQGRVRLRTTGITLTVESGADDVDAIFASLSKNRNRLAEMLVACDAESPEAARVVAQRHHEAVATAAAQRKIYEGLLLGKSFEEWADQVQAVAALPATRDLAVIDAEVATAGKQLASGEADAAKSAEAIARWTRQYTDPDSLGVQLLEAQSALKQTVERLDAIPELPDGFASAKDFVDALDAAVAERSAAERQLTEKREELARLTERLADRRSEDEAERADAAKRAFERARAKGRAYVRIRAELERITAASDDDPLADFGAKVAGIFSRITGSEASLEFDGQVPSRVVRESVVLRPDRLSQGGSGALALAVRLAMAEAYLPDGDGFIMLDDPFVHFDATRMRVAAEILRQFAQRSQVIYFTCHDHHAERLESPA